MRLIIFFSFHSAIAGFGLVLVSFLAACSYDKSEPKGEQIKMTSSGDSVRSDSSMNSLQGNLSLNEIATVPNSVVLTGMPEHRLVTVYKYSEIDKPRKGSFSSYEEEGAREDGHFMPGIDILYGFNLLNVAHYDLKSEKLNFLFNHPVLIKSLYYPSFIQDSLNEIPVNRDYYLVSVYDEDTNKDTLINDKDLRRIYHVNAGGNVKTELVPFDYSVIRSQYDPQNDIMYIYAKYDENKNGVAEKKESIHIFWVNLKSPARGKRLY